jgi:formate/nitrite transporter FocA (FNT family)
VPVDEEQGSAEYGQVAASAADTRMTEPRDGDADGERLTPSAGSGGGDPDLEDAFRATVEEGRARLGRNLPTLLATGLVGGIDVSIGVVALLIVEHETGSQLLGALAFTVGFVALMLARSELFTENFLVPVAPVIARQSRIRELVRLWAGTAITNLIGGWVVIGLFVTGKPEIAATADLLTAPLIQQGVGLRSFALAVIGGMAITVMTWMERNCDSQGPQLVAAVVTAFVLAAVPLNHVIVNSLEMFAALHTSADFGYAQYLLLALWWAFGNMVGGLFLVTLLRLVQVGRGPIERARLMHLRQFQPHDRDELLAD